MILFGGGLNRARTVLGILGVAVSAAMLLDMVMLATGMRASFRNLLVSRGFEIRLSPKGTLPFDTDATIANAADVERRVAETPGVGAISPVLGAQLHFVHPRSDGSTITSAALGTRSGIQGEYDVIEGRAPRSDEEIIASDPLLAALGAHIGDTVRAAAGYDPQLRALSAEQPLVIVGRGKFLYTAAGERVVSLPFEALQRMTAAAGARVGASADRASLFMIKLAASADADQVQRELERRIPTVSVVSIAEAIRQVEQRLSYFRQLAFILGAVSLVVGFLLVTTIVTVSVNERIGEIAVLRAIGVTRGRLVVRVAREGVALMLIGAVLGLGLGLVTARYLNSILASFPGLPEAIDFFLFQPRAAWSALGMLVAAGVLASVYPSWRAASLPIATTLRDEAVG
jgi:putative ABC transport system permease protein